MNNYKKMLGKVAVAAYEGMKLLCYAVALVVAFIAIDVMRHG